MLRNNKSGMLGLLEILIIILILGILGTVGWLTLRSDEDAETTEDTTVEDVTDEDTTVEEEDTAVPEISREITDLGDNFVTLIYPADVAELPATTPAAFVSYIEEVLGESTVDSEGCILAYTISKISQVNISGGLSSVLASSGEVEGNCGIGGGRAFWYLDNGAWARAEGGGQSYFLCSELVEMKIYRDFEEICLSDATPPVETSNPNGPLSEADL